MLPARGRKLSSQKPWNSPLAPNEKKTQVFPLRLQPDQLGLEGLWMLIRNLANYHYVCGDQAPSPGPNPTPLILHIFQPGYLTTQGAHMELGLGAPCCADLKEAARHREGT